MDRFRARTIIQHAVETTKPRWSQYAESWKNIDTIFILRGYEQQGFQLFKMRSTLENLGILSIESLGSILLKYPLKRNYDRNFAGGLNSELYLEFRKGVCGKEGILFEEAIRKFLDQKIGSPGRTFWKLLYQMLQACFYLKQYYSSSFSNYILSKYKAFKKIQYLTEEDFLNITSSEWESFVKKSKPWRELMGIGPNVFDFIFGDIIEAQFVKNSYKYDSSNQHILKLSGISKLILPFDREKTILFLQSLDLPFSLREINKGLYTYCSKTENANYGFCYDLSKCKKCKVENICEKYFSVIKAPSANSQLFRKEEFSGNTKIKNDNQIFIAKKSFNPKINLRNQINDGTRDKGVLIMNKIDWNGLNQSKYSLEQIFISQNASKIVEKTSLAFHIELTQILNKKNLRWHARTHIRGITYFCNNNKAFLVFNICRQFISVKFFTGNSNIGGLKKGTWVNKDDKLSSEPYRIVDNESIKQAVNFALKAYEISVNWTGNV